MIELKDYQDKAIEKLKTETIELLASSENKICVFKAPTGSGKTLMIAEALKRLVIERKDEAELSFVWISVNQLHDQSRIKLEKYYEDSRVLKCSDFEDLEDKKIGKNEILFFNWQSINKSGNIFIRENEQDNNLSNIVANTKDEGREIILKKIDKIFNSKNGDNQTQEQSEQDESDETLPNDPAPEDICANCGNSINEHEGNIYCRDGHDFTGDKFTPIKKDVSDISDWVNRWVQKKLTATAIHELKEIIEEKKGCELE
jgi:hypothetical protein